ncbi:hypothetical protein CFC21_076132 [Triticum aestivum]|uniref:Uncharacterized protein n=4 Tax=Triticinae TaxID=1648030 RepID=A0A3B6MK52_WHEAT|nr:uncharacterized protein LOC109764817 [Aegilops tauschii subsp. strangulata]KAF7070639.1 hypothetical protein CFC21_076132 [Triticum aestivum]
MDSRVSKSPPSSPPPAAAHDEGDGDAAAAVRVTSRLYLHRPGPGAGPLEKDAVLRRIRHRRRANRLRDTLRSLLVLQQQQPTAPEPEDAFTSP